MCDVNPPSRLERLVVLVGAAGIMGACGSSRGNAAGPTKGSSDDAGLSSGSGSSSGSGGGSNVSDASVDAPMQMLATVDAGACPNLASLMGGWVNVSPPGSKYTTTYSGIDAIAVRPDNPAIVYAGADSVGMFRSTDCGATWTLVNTGQNAAALSSGRPWTLVIDPVTPDVMYTVEGYGTSGLWKSTNAGMDWTNVLTPEIANAFYDGGQITGISMDPADHTHLVIESHQGTGCTYKGPDGGSAVGTCLAETTDSGSHWTLLSIPQPWQENSSVAILTRETWLWGGYFGGLWQTTDEGVTWTEVPVGDAGSPAGLPNAYASINIYQPYSWQDSTGRYYMPTTSWFLPGGVIRSEPNDTSSWTAIPKSPQAQMLLPTSTQLVMSSEMTPGYYIASQSDPTTWTQLAGPDAAASAQGGLGVFGAYDGSNHIFYSSCFNSGLWAKYIP